MDFETIKHRIQASLMNVYSTVEVREIKADRSLLKMIGSRELSAHHLKAVELFCNNRERFIMFYVVENFSGKANFSRPKSGIISELIPNLRIFDFHFDLTDNCGHQNDVMGRFITVAINNQIGCDLEKIMEGKLDEFDLTSTAFPYTLAWKVQNSNTVKMTYTAKIQIHYKDKSNDWTSVDGVLENGRINRLYNTETGDVVDLDDLFI